MSHGFAATFQVLTKSPNEASAGVLLPLLDAADPAVAEAALAALLDRRSVAGQHAIVKRLHQIDDRWRAIIDGRRGRLSQALRDAVVSTDPALCRNGCQAILWFKEYDLVPALVNALEDEANPNCDLVAQTLLQLAELLYADLAGPRDYRDRRDPQLVRRHVTTSLENSVKRFGKHRRLEVIESFLLLAARDNVTLRKVLADPLDPAYKPLMQVMSTSGRAGIIRLLLSGLDDAQPPAALLQLIGQRGDLKFVGYLLSRVGHAPGQTVAHNLKRITSIGWLRPDHDWSLDQLDGPGQHAAVRLVVASGLKRQSAFEFLERVLDRGHVAGRRAAVSALAQFNGADAAALVQRALDDPDPLVQAAALGQIRHRGVPGALGRLIDALDSSHEAIRQAARASLNEFTLARFLAAFETLDDEVRHSTGRLVAKVDLDAEARLIEEMQSQSRTRRLRAVEVARYVKMLDRLEAALIRLLEEDEDHLVRREAARSLAGSRSAESRAALVRAAREDRNVPVQEAARESLELQAALAREPGPAAPPLETPWPGEPGISLPGATP